VNIAAVVTDLDATIVGRNGISPATVVALAGLTVPLLAATARTPAGVGKLEALGPYLRTAICCNGALGYRNGTQIWRHEIDRATTADICRVLDERLPAAGIGAYDGDRWTLDHNYMRARGRTPSGENEICSRSRVATVRACALGISHPDLRSVQIADVLADAGIGPDRAQVSYGAPDVLDVGPPGVDKGTGVRRALAGLDVDPADAVCFGDAPNDLPMFAVVGHAVAVGNADPEVLAAADEICPGVDEDGFARTLRRLGLLSAPDRRTDSAGDTGRAGSAGDTCPAAAEGNPAGSAADIGSSAAAARPSGPVPADTRSRSAGAFRDGQ
jgi:hypothetical protein